MLAGGSARAQTARRGAPGSPQHAAPGAPTEAPVVADVVVTARRLDEAREAIQPGLGATTYSVSNQTIQALPGGDDQPLNQIILQLPGVVQDGFGQLHVRDDHNGLQYRLNGVILPEGASVFGQTLSPRLIDHVDLITGALPAQYGLRTAGILDITTKSGLFHNGGQVSIYGGSHGLYEPSVEYGGSTGRHQRLRLRRLPPQPARHRERQRRVRGDARPHRPGAGVRLPGPHALGQRPGGLRRRLHQRPLPDPQPRGPAALGRGRLRAGGRDGDVPSAQLNETQRETTAFAQASFLHDAGAWTVQSSLFARYSTLTYSPDVTGELQYNGLAQAAAKKDTALGWQTEGVYRLNGAHTLRGGVILQAERGIVQDRHPGLPGRARTARRPRTCPSRSPTVRGKNQFTYSVYLQDEWKILPNVVLNYGLRGDDFNAYRNEKQLSPRVNVVWTPLLGTTAHIGYARYFTPPPFELVGSQTVTQFQGTTGASPGVQATTPFAERQNYYDAGVQQKVSQLPGLVLGIDAYYRNSHNLIDEGQFGAPIILTPFNYRYGYIEGVELSANYAHGPWLAYANFAVAKAQGKDIVSSQFSFEPGRTWPTSRTTTSIWTTTRPTRARRAWPTRSANGALKDTQLGADLIYGSGLRARRRRAQRRGAGRLHAGEPRRRATASCCRARAT